MITVMLLRLACVAPGHVADLVVVGADPVEVIRRLRQVTHVVKLGDVHVSALVRRPDA